MALNLGHLQGDDTTVEQEVGGVNTPLTPSFLSHLKDDDTVVAPNEAVSVTQSVPNTVQALAVQDTNEQGIQLVAKESEDPFSSTDFGIPKDAPSQIRTEQVSAKYAVKPTGSKILSKEEFQTIPRENRVDYLNSLNEDDFMRFVNRNAYGERDSSAIRPGSVISPKQYKELTLYQQRKYLGALSQQERAEFQHNVLEDAILKKNLNAKKGLGEKIKESTIAVLEVPVGIGEVVMQGVALTAGYVSKTLPKEIVYGLDSTFGTYVATRDMAIRSATLIPEEQRSPWFNELVTLATASKDTTKALIAVDQFMKQNPPDENQKRELSNAANRVASEDNARFVWHSATPIAKFVENMLSSGIEATQENIVDPGVKGLDSKDLQKTGTLAQRGWNEFINHFPILGVKATLGPAASAVKKIQNTPFTAKQKSNAVTREIKQEIERIDAEKADHVKERIEQNVVELEQLHNSLKEADADIAKYSKSQESTLGVELYEAAKKAREEIVNEMASRQTNIDALSSWREVYEAPKAPKHVVEEHVRQTRQLNLEVSEAIINLNNALKDAQRPDYADIVAYRSEQLRIARDAFNDSLDQVHEATGSLKDVMQDMQTVNKMLIGADFPLRRYANLDLEALSVREVKKGLETGAIDPRDLSSEQLIRQAGETNSAEKAVLERMTTEANTRPVKPVEQTQLPSDQPQATSIASTQGGAVTPEMLGTVANVLTGGTAKGSVNASKGIYALASALGYKLLFAHSSKIRALGTPTAKKIADMFSTPLKEKLTPTGFTVTPHDVFRNQRVAHGKLDSRLSNILEPVYGYFGKVPGKLNSEVWGLLHGFTKNASKTALDVRVQLRKFLDDVHMYMNEAGIKVAYNADYMPIRYLDKKISRKKDAFIQDVIHVNASWINQAARKHNTTPLAIATEIADRIIREDGVPGTFKSLNPSFKQTTGAQMRSEYARKLIPNEAFLRKWSDTDLKSVLSNYVRKSTQRAEHARMFGEHGEVLKPLVDQLKQEMKNSGKRIDEVDSMIYDAADSVLGIYGRMDATLAGRSTSLVTQARRVNNGVYLGLTFATMAKVAITSLSELPTAVVKHGVQRFPLAFVKATGYAFHQAARKGLALVGARHVLPKSKALQHLESIGQIMSSNMMAEILADRYSPGSSKAVGIFYKGVGLEAITNFTKVLAYHMTKSEMSAQLKYANRPIVMRMIASGDFTLGSFLENRRAKNAAKELAEFGYNVNDIQQLSRGLDHVPTSVREAVDHAFAKTGDRTVMHPTPVDRPLWKSKEIAKTVAMLTAFTDSFSNIFVKKAFLDLADRHVTIPKKFAAIVPGLSLIAFIAYLAGVFKSHITGDDNPTEDFDNAMQHVFYAIDKGGVLGHISKVAPFFYDDKASVGFKARNAVFGPGPSSLIDVLDSSLSGPNRLAKTMARFTPGLNIQKDTRESIQEIYEDILQTIADFGD